MSKFKTGCDPFLQKLRIRYQTVTEQKTTYISTTELFWSYFALSV